MTNLPHPIAVSHGATPPPFEQKLLAKCINSGIAAVISTLLVFPLDLSKTRIQSQRNTPDSVLMYSSLIDCLRKTRQAEGIRGLYRGCAVNSVLIVPEKTAKLVSNDLMRHYLQTGKQPLLIRHELFAGAFAGAVQSFISAPMDMLKINLQDAGRLAAASNDILKQNISARQVAVNLVKENGIFSLWRGLGVTMGRNVCFSVIYFPVFYTIKRWGPRKNLHSLDPSSFWAFFSGCMAGGFAASLVTPIDVIKTRLQHVKSATNEIPYNGFWDALVKILRTEGPLALMKGGGLRTATIAPLFGLLQAIYYLGIGEHFLDLPSDD